MRQGPMRSMIARMSGSDFFRWRIALRISLRWISRLILPASVSYPSAWFWDARTGREGVGMELQRFAQVRQEIVRRVPSGVKVKLVANAFGHELFVQFAGALVEAEVILLAAVDVDCEIPELRPVLSRQHKRIVLVPVREVDGIAERSSQHSSKRPGALKIRVEFLRILRDQGGTLHAYRSEKFWVREGKTERAVSSHRNPGNPTRAPAANDPQVRLHVRNEFAQEEIAIAVVPVGRVDEEGSAA